MVRYPNMHQSWTLTNIEGHFSFLHAESFRPNHVILLYVFFFLFALFIKKACGSTTNWMIRCIPLPSPPLIVPYHSLLALCILIPNQHIVYLHFLLAKISSFRGIALRDEQLMNLRRRTDRREL